MIHIVRSIGVAWVGALCFLFAFLVSRVLNAITPKLDKTKPRWLITAEVTLQFAIIGVIVYWSRNMLKKVPFPLEGTAGYIHSELGELRSLPLMVFIFMFFQSKTQDKMKFLAY